jgi:hypothetical protein
MDYMWFDDSGTLRGMFIQFDVLMSPNAGSSAALALMLEWNKAIDSLNGRAPLETQNAWHTSSLWIRAEAEQAIIGSTIATLAVSLGCGFLGTFCFTHFNCLLSAFVVVAVLCVTMSLAFFMSVVMGWKTGAVEVLGLIVFVGYSITYSLHITHKYGERVNEIEGTIASRRRKAVWHAVMQMSNSVVGSAITTLGSSFFLFFCTMAIFVKLAAVLFTVTFFAALYSLAGLPAALLTCGPTGACGCDHISKRMEGESLGYESESYQGARHGRLDNEASEPGMVTHLPRAGRKSEVFHTAASTSHNTFNFSPSAVKSLAAKGSSPGPHSLGGSQTTGGLLPPSPPKAASKGNMGEPLARAE